MDFHCMKWKRDTLGRITATKEEVEDYLRRLSGHLNPAISSRTHRRPPTTARSSLSFDQLLGLLFVGRCLWKNAHGNPWKDW